MTAAEIYAEVATWPEGAKAMCFDSGRFIAPGTPPCRIDDTTAELAFIGSGVKWMAEQGLEPQLGAIDDGRFWLEYKRGPRLYESIAPTPLAAVGKAVRSVKQ